MANDPDAKEERIINRDLWQYGRRLREDGPYADNLDIDVLIVGAGFGGTYCLYEMRKAGYSTVVYDAGTSFGGTWRWNVYPYVLSAKILIVAYSIQRCESRQRGPNLRVIDPRGVQHLALDHQLSRLPRTSSVL